MMMMYCLKRVRATQLLLMSLLFAMTGCQAAYFFTPDKTEKIEAEYEVGGRSIAVLVWADQSVMDEYPQVRSQICRSMTHHLKSNLKDAKLIDARDVIEFQEDSGMRWESMQTKEICKELECDFVLKVDVEEFTTRASNTPHLRKSRVDATLNLFKDAEREQIESVYQDEIRTTYPPDSKHGAYDMDERDLIHASIEHFATLASRKFYAHEIRLEEKRD